MARSEKQRIAPSGSNFGDIYLTPEEREHVEIVDANDNYVVVYRRSQHNRGTDRTETTLSPTSNSSFSNMGHTNSSGDREQASGIPTKGSPEASGQWPNSVITAFWSNRFGYYARSFFRSLMKYKAVKFLQVLLAFYVGFLTYADIGPPGGLRDQTTGLIVDQLSEERTENGLILVNGTERPIVASTFFQVVCIGITRMSAFFMYPRK